MTHICGLLQKCFEESELALIETVKEKYHALNEEMITHLFWCELRLAVTKRNNGENNWSNALVQDLAASLPFQVPGLEHNHELQEQLGGLLCDVQLHNHSREGRTGGDFGIFTSLPVIEIDNISQGVCCIPIRDRALLVQAKLGQKEGPFGKLTKPKEDRLLKNRDFSALVLYSYNDTNKTDLNRFAWLSCKRAQQGDMIRWLKKRVPVETLDSDNMIQQFLDSRLGTDDEKTINGWIANGNDKRPRFQLTINWPQRPKSDVMSFQLAHLVPQAASSFVNDYQR